MIGARISAMILRRHLVTKLQHGGFIINFFLFGVKEKKNKYSVKSGIVFSTFIFFKNSECGRADAIYEDSGARPI